MIAGLLMLAGCSEKTPAPATEPTPSLPKVEFEAPERKIPAVAGEVEEHSDAEKKRAIRRVLLLNELTSAEENERACLQLLAVASKDDVRRLAAIVADEMLRGGAYPPATEVGLTPRKWALAEKQALLKSMADTAEKAHTLCRSAVGF